MLTNCAVTRATLALDALASTKRPSSIRAIMKANSTPSRWRVKKSPIRRRTRLFIVLLRRLAFLVHLLRGGHLAEQVVVDHLARDWRGVARPEAGILHDHGERDPRLVGGRIGDEECMVAVTLGHLALDVFLARLEADHLRSAGLAPAHVLRPGEGARASAFLVDPDHRVLDDREVLGLQVEGANGLRLDDGA